MTEEVDEFIEAPNLIVDFAIVRDADWNDPFPPLTNSDGSPLSLVGKALHMHVRPTYAHTESMIHLASTSAGGSGIYHNDPVNGLASVFFSRDSVVARLPVGDWVQFLVLEDAGFFTEIWRGRLRVHAGNSDGALT